jgi:hypothetical protein
MSLVPHFGIISQDPPETDSRLLFYVAGLSGDLCLTCGII